MMEFASFSYTARSEHRARSMEQKLGPFNTTLGRLAVKKRPHSLNRPPVFLS
jgi:hypothetical protein